MSDSACDFRHRRCQPLPSPHLGPQDRRQAPLGQLVGAPYLDGIAANPSQADAAISHSSATIHREASSIYPSDPS